MESSWWQEIKVSCRTYFITISCHYQIEEKVSKDALLSIDKFLRTSNQAQNEETEKST